MEMRCLRSTYGVRHVDQVRNEEVRRRIDVTRKLAGRPEQCVEVVWTCG